MINYLKFLAYFQNMLNKDFEAQAPFIKCARGCAKCCQKGDYPFSEMEVSFLKRGFEKLPLETKNIILNKIKNLIEEKKQSTEKTFMHECPFLINNECSVYDYRGLICRVFGLIYSKNDDKMQIPFCHSLGLNYADVVDKELNMITEESVKKAGYDIEPKAYNIHYDFITSDKISNSYGFDYGKKGALLDILSLDKDFYSDKN